MNIPRHLRKAYNDAISKDWKVSITGKGHLKWKPPHGQFYITANTASCEYGRRREIERLRKAGLTA